MIFRLNCINVKWEKTSNQLQHLYLQATHQDVHLMLFGCLNVDHTLVFNVRVLKKKKNK